VRRRGQGRKRSTTPKDDRFIVWQTLLSRRKTVPQLRSELEEVRRRRTSARTISRWLKEVGLKAYRTKKAPLLQRRHRVARLDFARERENWENDEWANVFFTDESRFCVNSIDGRERLYRRRGEQDSDFTPTVSYGVGSVMVWGGICLGARTRLVVVNGALNGYIPDVLQEHVVFPPHIGENFLLMHDNTRPHKARCVSDILDVVGIRTIAWPACYPDINPIEHVRLMLGRRLRSITPAVLLWLRFGTICLNT